MEKFLSSLHWMHTTGQTWRILRFLCIPQLAGWLLRKCGRPWVKSYGFQYFPDRAALDREHSSLGKRLSGATSLSAIWVVGQKFFDAGENVHVMKRLILPNPNSTSAGYYLQSLGQQHGLRVIED